MFCLIKRSQMMTIFERSLFMISMITVMVNKIYENLEDFSYNLQENCFKSYIVKCKLEVFYLTSDWKLVSTFHYSFFSTSMFLNYGNKIQYIWSFRLSHPYNKTQMGTIFSHIILTFPFHTDLFFLIDDLLLTWNKNFQH